ncbi:MAG: hypothetical protein ACYCYF_14025 [Anaerolineae bacterium]
MDAQDRNELLDNLNRKADDAKDAVEDAAVDVADEVKDFAEDVEEKRKKYISPAEVRKNKGCIGCGGAGVIMALMAAAMIITLL